MRLKQLKLVGFKSFVDPTVISLPDNLVAVVGPNGCGKSNVIDAVRWVLGESSAKNLRGASMTDVIFNGSSQRRATGQASVELLFDNSMGKLEGQFGAYQEIAVKRVVNRDGDSNYYLNNRRCRRRDITDLFLGTGTGARGYSIISQGTISQLIEAKPEELRAHLEEAAGISKYRERRRETLNRIAHTRENLQRVNDICNELDKQLNRLERQAKAAQNYRELQQLRRQHQIAVLVLKWQALEEKRLTAKAAVQQANTDLYTCKSQRAEANNACQQINNQIAQKEQTHQQLQQEYYQLATEIARTETTLRQQEEQQAAREANLQQIRRDCDLAARRLQEDKPNLKACLQSLAALEQKPSALQEKLQQAQAELEKLTNQQAQQQKALNQAEQAFHSCQHQAEMTRLRLQQLQEKQQQLQIQAEDINPAALDGQIETLTTQLEEATATAERIRAEVDHQNQSLADRQAALREQEKALQTRRQQLQQLEKNCQQALREQTVLKTQIATLGTTKPADKALAQWQKEQTALYTRCQVTPVWRPLVEWLLADALRGYLQSRPQALTFVPEQLQGSGFCLFSEKPRPADIRPDQLLAHIKGTLPNWPLDLEKIYTAKDWHRAQALLATLPADASVLSLDGIWLGHGWLKIMPKSKNDAPSLLNLQEKLQACETQIGDLERQKAQAEEQLAAKRHALEQEQNAIADLQQKLLDSKAQEQQSRFKVQKIQDERSSRQQQRQQLWQRRQDLQSELEPIAEAILQAEAEQQKSDEACEKARIHWQTLQQQEQTACNLPQQQQKVETLRHELYQAQLDLQKEQQRREQLERSLEREQDRYDNLLGRLKELEAQKSTEEPQRTALPAKLDQLNAKHKTIGDRLQDIHEALKALQTQRDKHQADIEQSERAAEQASHRFQQNQLKEQELAVRATTLQEQLTELDCPLPEAQNSLTETDTLVEREQALAACEQKIARLGTVNLAAIDEYNSEKERKETLAREHQDLTQALQTLEDAIAQIDKESRLRLRETFDAVNTGFAQIFPKLFGGGKASLRLTDDNLLEAGVLVMAQPPGKRNSSIHQLSGGEKAMTAVALVFALFQLNPSPFCLLDEVDAPLDDVNVGRFCALVAEMSQVIQFLFITHNKITMELASQLIGVTMREPGVSRIVSVDVDEAARLAKA